MEIHNIFKNANKASFDLIQIDDVKTNDILNSVADKINLNIGAILSENEKDLVKLRVEDNFYDRLMLTEERIDAIVTSIRKIALMSSPLGRLIESRTLANGLNLKKVSVALGVIGVIYEARPNVTIDVFALCFKSGNICILKGGKEALNTNKILVQLIKDVLTEYKINTNIVTLLPNKISILNDLLNAKGYVDVIIPRGGKSLIDFVTKNSNIPVIETGAGVVHTYFDKDGDVEIGKKIIFNAKTRRPSVCNSLDTLIIHKERLNDLFELMSDLELKNVIVRADEKSYVALKDEYNGKLLFKAKKDDFGKEFLSLQMSIKTVENIDEAIQHINKFGTKHSEAIISENPVAVSKFQRLVDAAVVYANTSTGFTDGGEFGFGAEIGISTQKLHARGPMGLSELTSYKWVIEGNGQVRNN